MQTRDALRDLPALWADLGDTRRGQPIGRRAPAAERTLALSDAARQARSAIRASLVAWCLIMADDYGLSLPPDTVRAMAGHVATQAGRLLASTEHADQLAHDMITAASEARRLAYPVVSVTVEHGCGARVRLDSDPDVITRCPGCAEAGNAPWWRLQLAPETLQPMTIAQGVAWLQRAYGLEVEPDAVRQWAARGHLVAIDHVRPEGQTTGRPAARYDPVALLMTAMQRRAPADRKADAQPP